MMEPTKLQPAGETLQFMQRMWDFVHALDVRSKRMMKSIGVTGPQRLVIRIVGQKPGQTASEIAAILGKHPSTLTGVIKRLERQRLVRRRLDPRDGRRVLLSLTDEGRALDVAQEGTVESAVEDVLSILPRERVEAAREVLGAIARSLEKPASARMPGGKR